MILLQPEQFSLSGVTFLDKKVNMIMDGHFTKIHYSDDCMTINGVFIEIKKPVLPPTTFYPKNILLLDGHTNKEWIQRLMNIEKQLLQYYMFFFGISGKSAVYSLKQNLQNGAVKYYKDYSSIGSLYYIKISGIWETPSEIGITYKIIEC